MKKTLLTICLITVSLITFAQIPSIGIKGGVNFATMTNSFSGTSKTSNSITTVNAGVFVDLKFGNISLQPALNFTGKGGSFQNVVVNDLNGQTTTSTQTTKNDLYYLQLPVNLVCHIPVIIGNIYFGAGPYIAQGISGNTSFSNRNGSQKVIFGSGEYDTKGQQFGANAIVGLKLNGGLLININYDLGLTNDDNPSSGESSKSRVFGISLGYMFL